MLQRNEGCREKMKDAENRLRFQRKDKGCRENMRVERKDVGCREKMKDAAER